MGGNAFEDTEKLTPSEYTAITTELLALLSPICLKLEPYIPLPEKEVHGDVDFLLILKPQYTIHSIIELLQLQKGEYIFNNNQTANTVYRKKQIDFNIAADEPQFQRCRFYKSYGGVGALLGLLLPSKWVKFSEDGLFCCSYQEHIKLEFNLCADIDQIMLFYGLNPAVYHKGFTNRRDLFNFLLQSRFLDPLDLAGREIKCTTKLLASFQDYLRENMEQFAKKAEKVQDCVVEALKYFKKEEEFQLSWKEKLGRQAAQKQRTCKWNGLHITKLFGVPSNELNALKKTFQSSFASTQHYEEFIDNSQFQAIVSAFAQVCQLHPL